MSISAYIDAALVWVLLSPKAGAVAFVSILIFALLLSAVINHYSGGGNILKSAADAGLSGYGYDIVERTGFVERLQDFMSPGWSCPWPVDNIVTNGPFGLYDSKGGRPGYVEIARRRIAADAPKSAEAPLRPAKPQESAGPLFGEVQA
jgi:hypothetical protein